MIFKHLCLDGYTEFIEQRPNSRWGPNLTNTVDEGANRSAIYAV